MHIPELVLALLNKYLTVHCHDCTLMGMECHEKKLCNKCIHFSSNSVRVETLARFAVDSLLRL